MFFQIDIEMDKEKREDEIYELRRQGLKYSHIATLFNISRSRAQQIYVRAKYKREVLETLTPLRRMLSNRTQKALVKHFGSESILEEPQKIAKLGRRQILRINNIGRKSLREISSALYSLSIIKDEEEWLDPYRNDTKITYRDREEPHSSPLPHHPAYGSVPGDSADQAESDPGEQKTE